MKKIYTINLGKQEYNGEGDLDLRDIQITSLPEGLKVGGSLYLDGTPIKGKYKVVNEKVVKVWGEKQMKKTDAYKQTKLHNEMLVITLNVEDEEWV